METKQKGIPAALLMLLNVCIVVEKYKKKGNANTWRAHATRTNSLR